MVAPKIKHHASQCVHKRCGKSGGIVNHNINLVRMWWIHYAAAIIYSCRQAVWRILSFDLSNEHCLMHRHHWNEIFRTSFKQLHPNKLRTMETVNGFFFLSILFSKRIRRQQQMWKELFRFCSFRRETNEYLIIGLVECLFSTEYRRSCVYSIRNKNIIKMWFESTPSELKMSDAW